MIFSEPSTGQIHSPRRGGIKLTMVGLSYRPVGYTGWRWRAGSTTLSHSRLYPSVRDYEFGYWYIPWPTAWRQLRCWVCSEVCRIGRMLQGFLSRQSYNPPGYRPYTFQVPPPYHERSSMQTLYTVLYTKRGRVSERDPVMALFMWTGGLGHAQSIWWPSPYNTPYICKEINLIFDKLS